MLAEPIVNGLKEEWGEEVSLLKLDIHKKENQPLVSSVGARFTPTFILFDGKGREVWRSVGRINPDEVRGQVDGLSQTVFQQEATS